jgi:hypothetical protein
LTESVSSTLHHPLHQPVGQLRKKPAGPHDLLLGLPAGQRLVHHLIGQLAAIIRHALEDPRWRRRLA